MGNGEREVLLTTIAERINQLSPGELVRLNEYLGPKPLTLAELAALRVSQSKKEYEPDPDAPQGETFMGLPIVYMREKKS